MLSKVELSSSLYFLTLLYVFYIYLSLSYMLDCKLHTNKDYRFYTQNLGGEENSDQ